MAQNAYAVSWFQGSALNMVFGLQLSFSRVVCVARILHNIKLLHSLSPFFKQQYPIFFIQQLSSIHPYFTTFIHPSLFYNFHPSILSSQLPSSYPYLTTSIQQSLSSKFQKKLFLFNHSHPTLSLFLSVTTSQHSHPTTSSNRPHLTTTTTTYTQQPLRNHNNNHHLQGSTVGMITNNRIYTFIDQYVHGYTCLSITLYIGNPPNLLVLPS